MTRGTGQSGETCDVRERGEVDTKTMIDTTPRHTKDVKLKRESNTSYKQKISMTWYGTAEDRTEN